MGSYIGDVMANKVTEKDKLLLEYEKLIDRLIRAEKWASDNNYTWDYVKANNIKISNERDNIIKEIENIRRKLRLPN